MKVAGIVAEYNPFHNGHQYHIEETKKQTGADYIIAVMSGDFVQRGAPAFLDKYERVHAALEGGCDLVLELPVIYSTASAEFFASGAVTLLHSLGVCDYLSFGSEDGSLAQLVPIADILLTEPEDYKHLLQNGLKSGLSFPAAREQALTAYLSKENRLSPTELSSFFKGSNNILGLEYIKALKKLHSDIEPATILRTTADYHDTNLHESISSASAIRHHMLCQNQLSAIRSSVPESTFQSIRNVYSSYENFPDFDHLTPYLHSSLMREIQPDLYLDWDEDLANRLRQLPWPVLSFSQIADRLKSRNITHSRIHRALLHLILGVKKEDFFHQYETNPVPYARILGFRKNSSQLIKEIKKKSSIPLITKPASIQKAIDKENFWVWNMDLNASRLYQSIHYTHYGCALPSAYERSPIIME